MVEKMDITKVQQKEKDVFADCYKLLVKYQEPPEKDSIGEQAFYDRMCAEVVLIGEKHKSKMCNKILFAIIENIQDRRLWIK